MVSHLPHSSSYFASLGPSVVEALDHDGCSPLNYLAKYQERNHDISDLRETVHFLLGNHQQLAKHLNGAVSPISTALAVGNRRSHRRVYRRSARLVKGRNRRWKVAQVLLEHGVPFPTDLDLDPVLSNAIECLEADIVNMLLSYGAHASSTAVSALVDAMVDQWNG